MQSSEPVLSNVSSFGPLPTGQPAVARGPLRICLATQEVIGPFRNGGIGTAYTALAEALASRGHAVTLLFLRGDYCENRTMSHWVTHYASKGIDLVPLPTVARTRLHGSGEAAVSYQAFSWLKERAFDVVHFPELGGSAYYTLKAKRQGLHFDATTVCIGTHSPIWWIRESNQEHLHGVSDLEMDFLERQSVANADVVVSPSRYMLEWMSGNGWQLPDESYVHQNVLPVSARGDAIHEIEAPRPINEIVFFGRLETRKGLELFCDAVTQLASHSASELSFKITFLGRPARVAGRDSADYIASRARLWSWPHEVVSDLGQPEAMAYLRQPGRLAVIPSFIENSPYTVLECLGARIPFLAAAVGGIEELIADENLESTTFPPTVDALANRLVAALRDGIRPAAPAIAFDATEAEWVRWHEGPSRGDTTPKAIGSAPSPRVSIRLSTGERVGRNQQGVAEAWRRQDYADDRYEIALGDAPSDAADFILFASADQVPAPHALSTYVQVAESTNADIVTSLADFTPENAGSSDEAIVDRWLYLGNAPALGVFYNCFGGSQLLVRREAFDALGELEPTPAQTWRYLARAVVTGRDLAVIPEALYRQTIDTAALVDRRAPLTSITAYVAELPGELAELVRYTQSIELRNEMAAASNEKGDGESTEQPRHGLEVLLEAAEVLRDQGASSESQRLVATGSQLARTSSDTRNVIDFLVGSARLLVELEDRVSAIDQLAVAIDVGSRADDTAVFLHALMDAGTELAKLGEYTSAEAALETACQLAHDHDFDNEHLTSRMARSWVSGRAGEPEPAKSGIVAALADARDLESNDGLAELHLYAGDRLADLGFTTLARTTFESAGQIGWQRGDRRLVAAAHERMKETSQGEPRPGNGASGA